MAVTLRARALLFDMDGTIVDSTAAVERAWAHWARRYKLNLSEVLHYSHGRPTLATMNFFGQRISQDKDWTQDADEMQRMERAEITGTRAIPGARDLLAQLSHQHWAVVTSAPRELAEARIQAAGLQLPRVLIPADEITHGKPHPEGYLRAAQQLGFSAADCLVFEDTPPGIEAALSAGMQAVGLLTTVDGERLRTPHLIRDYFDLRLRLGGNGFEIEIGS